MRPPTPTDVMRWAGGLMSEVGGVVKQYATIVKPLWSDSATTTQQRVRPREEKRNLATRRMNDYRFRYFGLDPNIVFDGERTRQELERKVIEDHEAQLPPE